MTLIADLEAALTTASGVDQRQGTKLLSELQSSLDELAKLTSGLSTQNSQEATEFAEADRAVRAAETLLVNLRVPGVVVGPSIVIPTDLDSAVAKEARLALKDRLKALQEHRESLGSTVWRTLASHKGAAELPSWRAKLLADIAERNKVHAELERGARKFIDYLALVEAL